MAELSLHELEDAITQGAARIDAAMCAWLSSVAEFDRREGFQSWECRSTAHFLNWRCGVTLRTARDHVRVARALEELPVVRAAFADGTLSYSKVRAITRIATPATEQQLVEWAHCATAAEIDRLVAGRRSVGERPDRERFVSWTHDEDDGSFLLRARLSPEEGELVLAALRAARTALSTGDNEKSGSAEPLLDTETLRPTNADALVAMAETTLAHGPTPVAGGDRHMVLVHVRDGEGHLDSGVALDDETTALITCDASTSTIVLSEYDEPLSLGRKSRDPSTAQRRALLVRDGGCRFPGCTQRVFVDAHHVQYWEHDGPTDLDNLVLVCRVHHRAIHHRGYRCETGPHQTFRFFHPDGLCLIAAPPLAKATGTVATRGASGRSITPDTCVPDWDGHHPDYQTAVEGLLWLEENAHRVEDRDNVVVV